MRSLIRVLALLIAPLATASISSSASVGRAHKVPISIANNPPPDAVRNGPLFERIKASATDIRHHEGALFSDALATDAALTLFPKKKTLADRKAIIEFLKIVAKDCQGPLSIDEGENWVQTSWVCHVGSNRKIREYFPFDLSPEIDLEFGVKDEKIISVFAMGLLWLPGEKLLQMDAAEHVPDEK